MIKDECFINETIRQLGDIIIYETERFSDGMWTIKKRTSVWLDGSQAVLLPSADKDNQKGLCQ
jgi:hypothetical protein